MVDEAEFSSVTVGLVEDHATSVSAGLQPTTRDIKLFVLDAAFYAVLAAGLEVTPMPASLSVSATYSFDSDASTDTDA